MKQFVGGMIVGVVGTIAGFAVASVAQEQSRSIVVTQYESELIALDDEAITEAYKEQVRHLFATWMKDSTGQPERARRGVDQARRAYAAIMVAIEQRKRQQQIPMPPVRPQ